MADCGILKGAITGDIIFCPSQFTFSCQYFSSIWPQSTTRNVGFFGGIFPTGYDPSVASATVFSLQNHCSYTVSQGTLSGNGAGILGSGGFALQPGSSVHLTAPSGWSGRFWARTGCTFDDSGAGKCATEDCAGGLKCIGGGVLLGTLVEFKIGSSGNGNKDFYDVSLVDGYNVGMGVRALSRNYQNLESLSPLRKFGIPLSAQI
ncbi:pathogenesis-related protein 5-like [Vigna angularis]|uniref:pathogenesis-related protein 5-like n=1 Tax=Phaseolus angularis TaxID=3914 RepID=UPI0022B2F9DC|nr:pathogenesis-related protein 5-like [Vigna angularis]